jgi:hypothetical protein
MKNSLYIPFSFNGRIKQILIIDKKLFRENNANFISRFVMFEMEKASVAKPGFLG